MASLRHSVFGLAVCLVLSMLSACQNQGPVPVVDIGDPVREGVHRVRKGDTLYSIAFRHGLDYKALARANNIPPPYTIFVDQRIRITGRAKQTPTRPASKPVAKKKQSQPAPSVVSNGMTWQWPVVGEIIRGYSLSGKVNKGLDIRSRQGSRVRAAADGVVVYAGGNLRGYGKLVIVKHNEQFLSAYGNNQEIKVSEGDNVKQGQVLASVGTNATGEEMLHFEIRLNGKPENPTRYLPRL
jgi:lipoprotein NlpD